MGHETFADVARSSAPETAAKSASNSAPSSGHGGIAGKLRLNRGPLRWWLILAGLLAAHVNLPRYILGTLLVIAGAAVRLIAKGSLRQGNRYVRRDKALTTAGPYRFTRNPFYLGNLIAEIGLLLIVGRLWIAISYLIVWAWVYRREIVKEEATLFQLMPEQFVRYCARVPRFLPWPGKFLPRSEVRGPGFSWTNPNMTNGGELGRTIRLLSYPLLFFAAAAVHKNGPTVLLSPGSGAMSAILGFFALNLLGIQIAKILRRLHDAKRTSRSSAP